MDDHLEFDNYPIQDNIDNEILMHRDAHFGGQFNLMIEYYNQEGKGAIEELPLERILFLAQLEEKSGQNLAPLLLSAREASKIALSKSAYKMLRDIYDQDPNTFLKARLIADLILSEEDFPENEINAIVDLGAEMVEPLLELLSSEDYLDPLFPGYGFAPELAAICLGKIGDHKAIEPLFLSIGKEGFFMEETLLEALRRIGPSAKEFLIKRVTSRPLTQDNEKAALALTYFSQDEEVATLAFEELKDTFIRKKPSLSTYLIFASEGLKCKEKRKEFEALSKDLNFLPPSLLHEMKMVLTQWKE